MWKIWDKIKIETNGWWIFWTITRIAKLNANIYYMWEIMVYQEIIRRPTQRELDLYYN